MYDQDNHNMHPGPLLSLEILLRLTEKHIIIVEIIGNQWIPTFTGC